VRENRRLIARRVLIPVLGKQGYLPLRVSRHLRDVSGGRGIYGDCMDEQDLGAQSAAHSSARSSYCLPKLCDLAAPPKPRKHKSGTWCQFMLQVTEICDKTHNYAAADLETRLYCAKEGLRMSIVLKHHAEFRIMPRNSSGNISSANNNGRSERAVLGMIGLPT
jgi:hypothetical protein